MNNVLSLNSAPDFNALATESNWRNLIQDDRTNRDIFFPVHIEPLANHIGGSNLKLNGEQVVVDTNQNQAIKIHGTSYELVTYKSAFDMVNKCINVLAEKGTLDITGAHIEDAVVNKGGKVIRQYFFPAHRVTVGDNQDTTMLRIVVINSYDGSCNFSLQAGGFRIVCLNGQVTGDKFIGMNMRHTNQINETTVLRALGNSVTSFTQCGETWKQMLNTKVTTAQADRILTNLVTESNKVNLNKLCMLSDLYKEQAKTLGGNQWALYNTMTAFSSHYEVVERNIANAADVRLGREKLVGSVIRSPDWQEIAKA